MRVDEPDEMALYAVARWIDAARDLVVLAVIAVIAVMATPNLIGTRCPATFRTARMEVATIEADAKMWAEKHDEFPASLADLTVATPPDPPLLAIIPVDP